MFSAIIIVADSGEWYPPKGKEPQYVVRCNVKSEPLAELDRFCDAMLAIHAEAVMVKEGQWPADARINNVFGDKNLVCSCPPLSAYENG